MSPLHRLEFGGGDAALIVGVIGEVDRTNAEAILSELLDLPCSGPLVLDLSRTEYFDSAGIAMLESVRKHRDVRLVVPQESLISRTLNVMGIDQIIECFDSVDSASASLR
jgi:anti-anti-sigma factor